MNILFVSQNYYPAMGGTEYLIKNLAEYNVLQGGASTVVCSNAYNCDAFNNNAKLMPEGKEYINGVQVLRCSFSVGKTNFAVNLKRFNFLKGFYDFGPRSFCMLNTILKQNAHIIFCSSLPTMGVIYSFLASKINKIPAVFQGAMHFKVGWFKKEDMRNLKYILNSFDAYGAYTEYEKNKMIALGIRAEKIKVLPLFSDDSLNALPKNDLRASCGLKENFTLGYIGQLVDYKGIQKILKSYVELKEKIDLNLVLAGGRTAWFENVIKKQIKELPSKIARDIHIFENFKEKDKAEIYGLTDIYVNLSANEAFGFSFLEALKCGCKVIALDTPVNREVFKKFGNVALIDNEGKLKEAVTALKSSAFKNDYDMLKYYEKGNILKEYFKFMEEYSKKGKKNENSYNHDRTIR